MAGHKNPALEGRNGRIWIEYCRGKNQTQLAEKYDLSTGRVSQIISAVREGIPEDVKMDTIKAELDLLRQLRAEVLEDVYDADPFPMTVGKDGDYLKDPETDEYVRDHSGRLAGLRTAQELTKLIHRLADLDAPKKVDVTMIGEEEAARRAAADATAVLFEEEKP